jgi:large subunit ribosomal protein L13
MLPKNTFRQRRLDRLKIYPAEAPESALGNVLKTWREKTGGEAFRDGGAVGSESQGGSASETRV